MSEYISLQDVLKQTIGVELPSELLKRIEVEISKTSPDQKNIYKHTNDIFDILDKEVPFSTVTNMTGNLVYCMRFLQKRAYILLEKEQADEMAREIQKTWEYIEKQQIQGAWELKDLIKNYGKS